MKNLIFCLFSYTQWRIVKSPLICPTVRASFFSLSNEFEEQKLETKIPDNFFWSSPCFSKIVCGVQCEGCPFTCLYLGLFINLFVLNEMSPIVSFLLGYVKNYFQKFVCRRIMSDQKVVSHYLGWTFSETTKCGTIRLECGYNFTSSLSLDKHLTWTHGRLCHPPHFS